MDPSLLLLLCLASYPLTHSLPIPVTGADFTGTSDDFASTLDITPDAQMDNMVTSEIIQRASKGTFDDFTSTPAITTVAEVESRTTSEMIREVNKDITTDAEEDNEAVSEIIEEVNNDTNVPLQGGDIRPRLDRSAENCTRCLWKKSQNGIVYVPYIVAPRPYTNFEWSMFVSAMKEYEVMTCVQFVNRSTETDYLSIESKSGCWSYVGRIGGKQVVSLSMAGCVKYNLIQHELMHTLGFYHEFTRRDRDQYINVMWQNISPGDQAIFALDDGGLQDMPYDLSSIVHYTMYSYSNVSGQPSMVPKFNSSIPMGKAIGLNNLDVLKINTLYNCGLCRKKVFTPGSDTYSSTSSGQGGTYCLYLIQSILKVLLQLSDINVPSSPDCNDAYIKVYDGVSPSSPVLLDKTCGSGPVPPLVSSADFMLVEIVNNQPLTPITFAASYATARYGGTFLKDNGIVTTPLFPGLYPSNADAVYSIIAPQGYKVSLTFYFFATLNSPTCAIEYLAINDGPLDSSPSLGTYCGTMPIPTSLVSTGNSMVLQFHSVGSTGFNGFYTNYKFVTMS